MAAEVTTKDRVFTAETLDPREYKRWKQWAKARLLRSNLKPEDKGPLLFTFLDGRVMPFMSTLRK